MTLFVWQQVPASASIWLEVKWFILIALPAELMAVYVDREGGCFISPAYAIYWAAACVLGPMPAIVCVAVTGSLATVIRFVSFLILRRIDSALKSDTVSVNNGTTGRCFAALSGWFTNQMRIAASVWPPHTSDWTVVFILLQCISGLVLFVGPAGLAYHYVGGNYLLSPSPHFNVLTNFVLPFIALVTVSILMDLLGIIVALTVITISENASIREVILKARLSAVEMFLPLVKPQLFSVVVGISLAYLYAQLHLLGFAIAVAPVIALRDFFNQWVAERDAYVDTITTLATYMQHYHPYTRGHLKRVADMSERLARELRLPVESIRFIGTAGLLHDIGKIGVSEEILDKTSKLSDEEWAKIREHPVKGAEIISHLEFLEGIVDWIRYHHKWYDGSGYPDTKGNATIPMEALIIATVDAFDAMTDDRELTLGWKCDSCGYVPEGDSRPEFCPICGAEKRRRYREPKSLDEAIDELRRGAGSQFHPMVVKAFLTMIERDGVHANV
ncbi:MAG: HD domain-containing phosphohydrolase [Armatimonadota bacterium]|nr:HD domain-containing protein [bacterium]